ncbi:MAG TPA: hypothetical protein VKF63_03730 [Terracidiphilus sp.]|nr:hypothetical protein [Terracidiphilus sp.]
MFRKTICAHGLLVLLVTFMPSVYPRAAAQESSATRKRITTHNEPKPLDPNDPRLTFSFPIQPGGKSFRFKVEIDNTGEVTGVSVFREDDSSPFQKLPACGSVGLPNPVTDYWDVYGTSMLLKHADLNFDGFEDLELLQYYIPHLGKKSYCIFLWDNKAKLFRYSNELAELSLNPVPHPENKTLTTREDWQGGASQESTYRWNSGKLEMIEQDSLLGDWSQQTDKQCGFTFTCNRLVNGEMVTTLEKPVCTSEEMNNLPECPAASTPPVPKAPAKTLQP